MKARIDETDIDAIRRLLLSADATPVIEIGEEDVDRLFDSATFVSFHKASGRSVDDALKDLAAAEIDGDKATKALLVINCRNAAKIRVSELSGDTVSLSVSERRH